MAKPKVLFVSQEIEGYLPKTEISHVGRYLPQRIQEQGKEIRSFMPSFGLINERRNQLHEVIRLSGMNLIINDTDHPLIIKVASIQSARMQVYFIDNEDFFQRKALFTDDAGDEFEDNDERAIFFARGVLETVKKLRWTPDIIHCHGWFSALVPLFVKKTFFEDPIFANSKVVFTVYNNDFKSPFCPEFKSKIMYDGIDEEDVKSIEKSDFIELNKLAIDHSDAIIFGSEEIEQELIDYSNASGKPVMQYNDDESFKSYNEFYDTILG